MKKTLGGFILSAFLTAPVAAADLPARMPVKAPAPVIVTVFDWTGCYIGGHAGYAWGKKKVRDLTPAAPQQVDLDHDIDGFIAGGQVGCNLWQRDRWVFGLEGQASWADLDGSVGPNNQTFGFVGFRTDANIIGSLAGRLGYAFGATGQTLIFIKGGAAFINEKFYATGFAVPANITFSSDDDLRWGWMIGGGLEHALTRNWSIKGEYNYSNFGSRNIQACSPANVCDEFSVKQHVHLVKFGINYRFGGPVVARY